MGEGQSAPSTVIFFPAISFASDYSTVRCTCTVFISARGSPILYSPAGSGCTPRQGIHLFPVHSQQNSLSSFQLGYILEFIKQIACRSQLVGHQLIWNMQTNMYMDEEKEKKDPALYDTLDILVSAIVNALSGRARDFYRREFDFFNKITHISGEIRPFPKGNRHAAVMMLCG